MKVCTHMHACDSLYRPLLGLLTWRLHTSECISGQVVMAHTFKSRTQEAGVGESLSSRPAWSTK